MQGKHKRISIHALREEGDHVGSEAQAEDIEISIHALREEGDESHTASPGTIFISIHALREEGDKSSAPGRLT